MIDHDLYVRNVASNTLVLIMLNILVELHQKRIRNSKKCREMPESRLNRVREAKKLETLAPSSTKESY